MPKLISSLLGRWFVVLLSGWLVSSAAAQVQNPLKSVKDAYEKAKQQQQPQRPQPGQAPGNPQAGGQPGASPPNARAGNSGGNLLASTARIESEVVAPLVQGGAYAVSPHGQHVAIMVPRGSRFAVSYDNVLGPQFDEILGNSNGVTFSPDGKCYAYIARSGQEFVFMVDGKEAMRVTLAEVQNEQQGGTRDGIHFTSNSRHVYFSLNRQAPGTPKPIAVFYFDGKPERPASNSFWSSQVVFSPDGDHYAYLACDPNCPCGQEAAHSFLIVDGKQAPYVAGPLGFTSTNHLISKIGGVAEQVLIDGQPYIRANGVNVNIPPVGDQLVSIISGGPENRSAGNPAVLRRRRRKETSGQRGREFRQGVFQS